MKNRLQAENVYMQEEIKLSHNFEEIVGESQNFKDALRQVEQVAPTDTTVSIRGESSVMGSDHGEGLRIKDLCPK